MDTEQIRETLQSEERRLQEMSDGLREGSDLGPDSGTSPELSMVDQHPADIGTETNQRSVNLSLIEQIESELGDVESALQKLEDGTYGICEACGDKIDEARLEAIPSTRFCINDQSAVERSASGSPSSSSSDRDRSPAAPIQP
jgi:DnaK suppressor protein